MARVHFLFLFFYPLHLIPSLAANRYLFFFFYFVSHRPEESNRLQAWRTSEDPFVTRGYSRRKFSGTWGKKKGSGNWTNNRPLLFLVLFSWARLPPRRLDVFPSEKVHLQISRKYHLSGTYIFWLRLAHLGVFIFLAVQTVVYDCKRRLCNYSTL